MLSKWFKELSAVSKGLITILAVAATIAAFATFPIRLSSVELSQAQILIRVQAIEVEHAIAKSERDLLLRLGCTTVRSLDPQNEPAECARVFRR